MNTSRTWRPENVAQPVEMIDQNSTVTSTNITQIRSSVGSVELAEGHDQRALKSEPHDLSSGNSKITAQGPVPPLSQKKRRQLGPAPIASFEDIVDEMDPEVGFGESTEAKRDQKLGMDRVTSKQMTLNVKQPTPRIDISRASSSSQHDSREDSSPENVFEQIGTGTLQDNAMELGFREDGAHDLRSSTEELHFMDTNDRILPPQQHQNQTSNQQQCRSPVTVRIEDQTMDQNMHRKDSVSSEVAALLCISGRTSRISSVGSQGSAISRLSAVSRSPSPHKMILETSFCGPKPVDLPLGNTHGTKPSDALEQILLARTLDPTQAILAEGIIIKTMPPAIKPQKSSVDKPDATCRPRTPVITPEVTITRPQMTPKSVQSNSSGKELNKIVGKTENGTEYIRIKLKPDHFYVDQGLAANEHVVTEDNSGDIVARKPGSLNIQQKTTKAHGEANNKKASASPKPSKHIFRSDSRSPSPAPNTSRKNSFCSLFKSKDANTPDMPISAQSRKKSSGSMRESEDGQTHRSRSCGKIKDSGGDRLSPSPTPSKQKSVLGLFKTKRSGSTSKSKSSSPNEHEDRPTINPSNPPTIGKPRLRYYEADTDNMGIMIPLHTPPEEKGSKLESEAIAKYNEMLDKQMQETELGRSILSAIMKHRTSESSGKVFSDLQKQDEISVAPLNVATQPKSRKNSRIEYPDGSVRIPLRSPSDEDPESDIQVYEVTVECVPPLATLTDTTAQQCRAEPEEVLSIEKPTRDFPSEDESSKNFKVDMIPQPLQIVPEKPYTPPQPPPPTPSTVLELHNKPVTQEYPESGANPTREKKHILFTTKIGSGEEQLFQTQFSVSKTESLCSPTSEIVATVHSDNAESEENKSNEPFAETPVIKATEKTQEGLPHHTCIPAEFIAPPPPPTDTPTSPVFKCEFSSDEEASVREAPQTTPKQRSTDEMDYKLGPQRSTTEENALVSSGSERDSETCTDSTTRPRKHHLPHNLTIDEHESTGLVSQLSYEDELPFVPTSLPEERSKGVAIIPVKERATMDVKTFPVERPRSTTPLNPSFVEDYCGTELDTPTSQPGEKLKISLPRKESREKILHKSKSPPRRMSNVSAGKSWFEYEARGEQTDQFEEPPPPPLPPKADPTNSTAQWIDFENIPEKRKPPKRIVTIPQSNLIIGECPSTQHTMAQTTTVYQFVKPDECQCECHHESQRKDSTATAPTPDSEEAQPLLITDGQGTSEGSIKGLRL